jgi:hypothetical protein
LTCKLMSPEEEDYLIAKHGPTYVAWEWADRWLKAWWEKHPEDERDELELLTTVYGFPEGEDIQGA